MATDREREVWRECRARYRARHLDRCSRCARKRDLPGRWCSRCLAEGRERRYPEHAHDTLAHAAALRLAWRASSRCAACGLKNSELGLLGEHLEVDRINPWRGYVPDNMQLLARSLNRAKGRGLEVPEYAIDELRWSQRAQGAGF